MKTIFKYPLLMLVKQKILIPKGGEILRVQTQREIPNIWVLVDTEKENQQRTIGIYGTGFVLPSDLDKRQYIGTFELLRGEKIYHVFEL